MVLGFSKRLLGEMTMFRPTILLLVACTLLAACEPGALINKRHPDKSEASVSPPTYGPATHFLINVFTFPTHRDIVVAGMDERTCQNMKGDNRKPGYESECVP